MTTNKRQAGRKLREIKRLDAQWKAEGKQEGKTESRLAWKLGIAARAGLYKDSDKVRKGN